MKIEEARDENGKLIGHRIEASGQTVLVWDDQKSMPGIRVGDRFVPNWKESVSYESMDITVGLGEVREEK